MKDRYLICAFFNGKELHYTGKMFSSKGRSQKYSTEHVARRVLSGIREKHGDALRKAKLYVRPIAGVNVDHFKKNPSGFRKAIDAYARELDEADSRLEGFSGRTGKTVLRIKEPPIKTGLVVGKLLGVMYETKRDGVVEKYRHDFKKNSRPLLIAAHDGTRIGIVGGQYQFTDAGIEDT